jgi:hypothetical protein
MRPEYLRECTFLRLPGSLEKIGPSGTRFTTKLLYFYVGLADSSDTPTRLTRKRYHWRSVDMAVVRVCGRRMQIDYPVLASPSMWLTTGCHQPEIERPLRYTL